MAKILLKEIDLFYSDFIIRDMMKKKAPFYYNPQTGILSNAKHSSLKEISYEEAKEVFSNPKKLFFTPPTFNFVNVTPNSYFSQYSEGNIQYKYPKMESFEGIHKNHFLYFNDDIFTKMLMVLAGTKYKYDKIEKNGFIKSFYYYATIKGVLFQDTQVTSYLDKNKNNSLIIETILEPHNLKNIISQINKNMYGITNFNDFLKFTFSRDLVKPEHKAEIFGAFLDASTLLCSKKQNCEILFNYCLENFRDDMGTIKSEMSKRGLIDTGAKKEVFQAIENNVALLSFSYLEIVKNYPVRLDSHENKNYYDTVIQMTISSINRIIKKYPDFGVEHINLYHTKDTGHNLFIIKKDSFKNEVHIKYIEDVFLDSLKYVNDFINEQIGLYKAQCIADKKPLNGVNYNSIKHTQYRGKEELSIKKIDSILKTVIEKRAISNALDGKVEENLVAKPALINDVIKKHKI